jgi:hypothetical protein
VIVRRIGKFTQTLTGMRLTQAEGSGANGRFEEGCRARERRSSAAHSGHCKVAVSSLEARARDVRRVVTFE